MTEHSELSAWIGRTETPPAETLSSRILDRFRASLHPHLAETDEVPPGIHWCLSPPAVETPALASDGHPAKGGFLPPVPLPRRMWAGGEVEFLEPLREGDEVVRSSRIENVQHKSGRTGQLYFVTVRHEITTKRGLAIRERQDIVYREAATAPASPPVSDARSGADAERAIAVDPVLLFRYSALTFNGHRIHYDETYAREIEFYPGLVIHGPMQATLLLHLAISQGGSVPRRFSFRGVSPACGPQTLRARAWKVEGGFDLATITAQDVTAMTASARW